MTPVTFGHGVGFVLPPHMKYETPPFTLRCPKWTCAKSEFPPSSPSYLKTKWSVSSSTSHASNVPKPVDEIAGTSWSPLSSAWNRIFCGTFGGPSPPPAIANDTAPSATAAATPMA